MPLLLPSDIESERNLDLTAPVGEDIAASLIASATDYASAIVGYPLEQTTQTTYFDQGGTTLFLPTAAPVSNVVVARYNEVTGDYVDVDATLIRASTDGIVFSRVCLPKGFQAVRVTYTTGWTAVTLPRDLRNALIDLVTLRVQAINNQSVADPAVAGPLKRVQSGNFTAEYAVSAPAAVSDAVPDAVLSVFNRYRRAVIR